MSAEKSPEHNLNYGADPFQEETDKPRDLSCLLIGSLLAVMLCMLGVITWYIFEQMALSPLAWFGAPTTGQQAKLRMTGSDWVYLATDQAALSWLLDPSAVNDQTLVPSLLKKGRLTTVPSGIKVHVLDTGVASCGASSFPARQVKIIQSGGYKGMTGWVLADWLERISIPRPTPKPRLQLPGST